MLYNLRNLEYVLFLNYNWLDKRLNWMKNKTSYPTFPCCMTLQLSWIDSSYLIWLQKVFLFDFHNSLTCPNDVIPNFWYAVLWGLMRFYIRQFDFPALLHVRQIRNALRKQNLLWTSFNRNVSTYSFSVALFKTSSFSIKESIFTLESVNAISNSFKLIY